MRVCMVVPGRFILNWSYQGGVCSRNCDKPRLIEALRSKRIRDIACGSSHSAAIASNGDLYTWGLGEYGRLGHGDNTTQLRPKQVKSLAGQRVIQVALGSGEFGVGAPDRGEPGAMEISKRVGANPTKGAGVPPLRGGAKKPVFDEWGGEREIKTSGPSLSVPCIVSLSPTLDRYVVSLA
ncbi:hypothetical protein NP493_4277g00004 [Ridgeia piscesae]|uniref:Uncharacterized protein n=1 Tax=Ridgeia piscesae TaxID=27915 RepID=A0AAD9J199_RIDPI|nr:hypothetical protein NP493_4277g00004 [Ridgeia piscesae]